MYRNSRITFAAVTDGLSNTIAAGERTPFLSDSVWPGVVPGSAHFSYGQFTNDDWDGPGSYVASNSGPSIYEAPAIIHPPNSPVGDTDEMYSLHPAGRTSCCATVGSVYQADHQSRHMGRESSSRAAARSFRGTIDRSGESLPPGRSSRKSHCRQSSHRPARDGGRRGMAGGDKGGLPLGRRAFQPPEHSGQGIEFPIARTLFMALRCWISSFA